MIVYVATVDTYYEVVAVATDEQLAIRRAAEKALEYLKQREGEDTYTVEGIIEDFGVFATRVELDGAGEFVGN